MAPLIIVMSIVNTWPEDASKNDPRDVVITHQFIPRTSVYRATSRSLNIALPCRWIFTLGIWFGLTLDGHQHKTEPGIVL